MSTNIRYRDFTLAPVNTPFPPTGSFNYRNGFYHGRPMTPREQRFEDFVNGIQARHDEVSELSEWRRRKNHEERAILLYHQVGEDMEEFSRQMKTLDQQETEFQCQRMNDKAQVLDPRRSLEKLREMELERQQILRAEEAKEVEERAREQLKIQDAARLQFRIEVEASTNPMANTDLVTNAAGPQHAHQRSKLAQSRLMESLNSNQALSSTGADSSRQQAQKRRPNDEEIRRQFFEQVRSRSVIPHNDKQTAPLTGLGSSKQQVQETTLSEQESRLQVHCHVQPAPTRTTARRSARPSIAAFSRDSDGFDLGSPVSSSQRILSEEGKKLPRPSSSSSLSHQTTMYLYSSRIFSLTYLSSEEGKKLSSPSSSPSSPHHIPPNSNPHLEPIPSSSDNNNNNNNNNNDPSSGVPPPWRWDIKPTDRFACLDRVRRDNPAFWGPLNNPRNPWRATSEQEMSSRRFEPDVGIWGREVLGL